LTAHSTGVLLPATQSVTRGRNDAFGTAHWAVHSTDLSNRMCERHESPYTLKVKAHGL